MLVTDFGGAGNQIEEWNGEWRGKNNEFNKFAWIKSRKVAEGKDKAEEKMLFKLTVRYLNDDVKKSVQIRRMKLQMRIE